MLSTKKFRMSLLTTSLMALGLTACGGDNDSELVPVPDSLPSSSSSSESSSESSSSSSSEAAYFSIEPDYNLYSTAPSTFPVGVAISAANEPYSIFNNSDVHDDAAERRDLIPEHFNQLTAGNIMKMSYMYENGRAETQE